MKILIVSEYIAPLQAIASIRWTKIAKYLKISHSNIHITVLTNEKIFDGNNQRKDLMLEKDMCFFDEYWQLSKSNMLKKYEAIKKKNSSSVSAIQIEIQQCSSKGSLVQILKKEGLLGVRDIKEKILFSQAKQFLKDRQFDFDVVISTYGPAWPHLVAERIKKKHPSIFWIADFRDPYAKETDGPFSFWRHNLFVKRHCIAADVITRVTDDLYLNEPENAVVKMLPNGYDPQEALMPLAPPIFSLVFTGTLYGEQTDLGVVFQALKDLQCEKKINPKTVRLIYAGAQGAIAQNFSKKHDAECFIDNRGIVSREDAMHIQQNAAILIQLGWNNEHEKSFWTGKTYEYMMANKPILYVMTGNIPNSAPSQNIHHLGGVCYEQCRHKETYPLLKQYILDKYEEWKRTGNVSVQRDEEYVQQYSYANIAESVWKLICSQEKGRV